MTRLARQMLDRAQATRQTRLGRALWIALYVKLGLAGLAGALAAAAFLYLSRGPVTFDGLEQRVVAAISEQVGADWSVTLDAASLGVEDGGVALRARDLAVRNPQGALVLKAPQAIVSLNTLPLAIGSVRPRGIDFRDLQLRGVVLKDGALAFAPAPDSAELVVVAPPPPEASAPSDSVAAKASPAARALKALFDLILDQSGPAGEIDFARLTNARLLLEDETRGERTIFENVNARVGRSEGAGRHFDVRMTGPRGEWRLAGDVRESGGRRDGFIHASEVPIQDLVILAGLSGAPAATDLKVSGRIDAAISGERVMRLDAKMSTGSGTLVVDDKDTPPIAVESVGVNASWNAEARSLRFDELSFRSGATRVTLGGELVSEGAEPWRLKLFGKDAVVDGPTAEDAIFTIETIEADLAARDGGVEIRTLALKGPALDARLSGTVGTGGDPRSVKLNISGRGTPVRTALRLWPNAVAPPSRRYLVENLAAGVVDSVDIAVDFSGADILAATSGGPIHDHTVKVAFAVSDAELKIAEGMPRLDSIEASGTVTGTTADVRAPKARAKMRDKRVLQLSDGSFSMSDTWADGAEANVGFRVVGTADALGSFLQSPKLAGLTGVSFDPGTMKGKADLKVSLVVPIIANLDIADVPIIANGAITELSIDRVFGKEKLENAALNLGYEQGSLVIRGGGNLMGGPAQIEIRQPRGGNGEATVAMTLDEAARAKRGMSFGQQLTGSVALKAALALGKGASPMPRVEIDLARAGVNNLIPGWTKAVGQPGRITFNLAEDGSEARDVVLDSGTVQIRGTVGLMPDGQFRSADVTSLKLSRGDDMRAKIERSGNTSKVVIRGNVADARPFLKGFTSPGGTASASKDPREIDLDLAINIMTGFNDEALTGAQIKARFRGDDLYQAQLSGKFRSANVTAQTVRPERGAPYLAIQSRDAGATLRYFDVYRRMYGGDMNLSVSMGDGPQAGNIVINSFALRNEPALGRLVAEQATPVTSQNVDPNDVSFSKLQAEFSRTATRLDFRDAAMSGPLFGFTASGSIDYGRDRTDINGTFLPLYALNNAFARIPVLGMLLGGGSEEGLFGVSFRVAGKASSPNLTINPLSAVAPGVLRKLMGAITSGGDGTPPPAPSGER